MWGKQEDKNRDLIVNILKTKMELNLNIKNYEYAEQDQIDYFLYQMIERLWKNYLIIYH